MLSQFLANEDDAPEDAVALVLAASREDVDSSVCLSRSELLRWISRVATVVSAATDIQSRGLVVAVALPTCTLQETACMLAVVAQSDWVFVPVDVSLPLERQRAVLRHAAVDCVLTWRHSELCALSSTSASVHRSVALPALLDVTDLMCLLSWPRDTENPRPHWLSTPARNNQTPLYVLFTSGSTAQPKGVVGTREGTLSRLRWMWQQFPFARDDRVVRATRLSFVDSVAEILGAVLQRVPLVHVPISSSDSSPTQSVVLHDPSVFLSICLRHRVTRVTIVPSVLRMLLQSSLVTGSVVWKLVIVSGEALSLDVAEQTLRVTNATLLNLYGSTEVSGDVSWFALKTGSDALSPATRARWRRHGVPIGVWPPRPVGQDTQLSLVKDELWVAGAVVAPRGYLVDGVREQHERRWSTALENDGRVTWFRTGDVCVVDGGELFFHGRVDRQVKLRGLRLQLEDVERELRTVVESEMKVAIPGDTSVLVTTTAASAIQSGDATDNNVLLAFIVVDQWSRSLVRSEEGDDDNYWRCLPSELRGAMVSRLTSTVGALYVPHDVVVLLEKMLPRLPSGKVDYRELQSQWRQRMATSSRVDESDPHRRWFVETLRLGDELETHASRSWLEVGGDSLQAAALSWRLQEHNGMRLPPEDVVRPPFFECVCVSVYVDKLLTG
ncbi:hypothetical protein PINS_up014781 [Pythium insidiosum]|nr:hypothetical protein PINS_up014781 [Pythium insidiosum]